MANPNEAFPPGTRMQSIKGLTLRASESSESEALQKLPSGAFLTVLALGQKKNRLLVEVEDTGVQGWISCVSSHCGRALLRVANRQSVVGRVTVVSDVNGDGRERCSTATIAAARERCSTETVLATRQRCSTETVADAARATGRSTVADAARDTGRSTARASQAPPAAPCPSSCPNLAYGVGQAIVCVKNNVQVREQEDLESAECGMLHKGTNLTVLARGTGPSGRRLRVRIGEGLDGWISCQSNGGHDIVRPVDLPNLLFSIGQVLLTLRDGAVLREEEDKASAEIRVLGAGERLTVVAHGTGATGRRLKVVTSGAVGWLSCVSEQGDALVLPAEEAEGVATAMAQGAPQPAGPSFPTSLAQGATTPRGAPAYPGSATPRGPAPTPWGGRPGSTTPRGGYPGNAMSPPMSVPPLDFSKSTPVGTWHSFGQGNNGHGNNGHGNNGHGGAMTPRSARAPPPAAMPAMAGFCHPPYRDGPCSDSGLWMSNHPGSAAPVPCGQASTWAMPRDHTSVFSDRHMAYEDGPCRDSGRWMPAHLPPPEYGQAPAWHGQGGYGAAVAPAPAAEPGREYGSSRKSYAACDSSRRSSGHWMPPPPSSTTSSAWRSQNWQSIVGCGQR